MRNSNFCCGALGAGQARRGPRGALTGEAGIGKLRLTRALQESIRGEPHTLLTCHCSPYHQDSALYPVIGQLTRAAGISWEESTEAKLYKVEALLEPSGDNLAADMALFAA